MVTNRYVGFQASEGARERDMSRDPFVRLLHIARDHAKTMAARLVCDDPHWRPASETYARWFLLKCYHLLGKEMEKQAQELRTQYGVDPQVNLLFPADQQGPQNGLSCYRAYEAVRAFTLRKIQAAQQSQQSYVEASITFNRSWLPVFHNAYKDTLFREHLASLQSPVPRLDKVELGFLLLSGWMAVRIKRYGELMRAVHQAHPTLSYDDGLLLELPGEAVQLAVPYLNQEIAFPKLPGLAASGIQNRFSVSSLEVLTDELPVIARLPDPLETVLARADVEAYWSEFTAQQRAIISLKAQDYERVEIADSLSTTDEVVKRQLLLVRRKARTLCAQYS